MTGNGGKGASPDPPAGDAGAWDDEAGQQEPGRVEGRRYYGSHLQSTRDMHYIRNKLYVPNGLHVAKKWLISN